MRRREAPAGLRGRTYIPENIGDEILRGIDMYFNSIIPPDCKIVDFSPSHLLLMEHNKFQRANFDLIPGYLEHMAHQATLGPSFTILCQGEVMFCAGIIPFFQGTAEAWMMRDNRVSRVAVFLCKAATIFFDKIGPDLRLRRIQILVHLQNHAAVKWAKYLKFTTEGTLKQFGPDGADHLMMARIY